MSFTDEASFIGWWRSIKKLTQTKATVEARQRQDRTTFDNVLERNGLAWGGNIDGFLLDSRIQDVKAVLEIRQSRNFVVEMYDPANYFGGTKTKGGDFKTWLPLIYVKKAYGLPIILITMSTKSPGKMGFAEIQKMSETRLYYSGNVDPTKNVTGKIEDFAEWLQGVAPTL